MHWSIYVAIFVAIIFRLVIMKGSFILPTFYRNGNELTFNLGSISTIIIGLVAAFGLVMSNPEQYSNWLSAGMAAYVAPQVTDAIITAGTRYKDKGDEDAQEEDEVA